jgi:H+/gluconate symporter-like permease
MTDTTFSGRAGRVLRYLIARLQESSTWRGLVLLATAAGGTFKPEQVDAIVLIGVALAGAIAVAFPDVKPDPKPDPAPPKAPDAPDA